MATDGNDRKATSSYLPASKRPKLVEVEDSTSTGLQRPIAPHLIGDHSELMPANVRTAYDINRAIENAPNVLPPIGTIPILESLMVKDWMCWEEQNILEWAKRKCESGEGCLSGIKLDQFDPLANVQKLIDQISRSYCCEPQSYDYRKRIGSRFDFPDPGKEHLLHDDAFTVSITLPALQKVLGRDEAGSSTFKITDFLLPLATFADPSVSGVAPPEHPQPSTRLITKETGYTLDSLDYSRSLLDALYLLGVPAPYGKVSTLETIVDESVHKARQINAENFSVSDELISKIESLWAERFYPSTVRVEPYKIKLYDPWGKFSTHKDTPETGLLGTFLVGLSLDVNLNIHLSAVGLPDKDVPYRCQYSKWRSSNGSYCVFYSDVPHKVHALYRPSGESDDDQDDEEEEVDDDDDRDNEYDEGAHGEENGTVPYQTRWARLFGFISKYIGPVSELLNPVSSHSLSPPSLHHATAPQEYPKQEQVVEKRNDLEEEADGEADYKPKVGLPMRGTIAFKVFLKEPQNEIGLVPKVVESLNVLKKPFGILLRHDYTTELHKGLLKGSDYVLYKSLGSLQNAELLVLPVLTTMYLSRGPDELLSAFEDEEHCEIRVYPFNEAMVECSLNSSTKSEDHWPEHLKNIPFLTSGLWSTVWSNKLQEGAVNTGNESRPEEQHSIYISGAIIVLDKQ